MGNDKGTQGSRSTDVDLDLHDSKELCFQKDGWQGISCIVKSDFPSCFKLSRLFTIRFKCFQPLEYLKKYFNLDKNDVWMN